MKQKKKRKCLVCKGTGLVLAWSSHAPRKLINVPCPLCRGVGR